MNTAQNMAVYNLIEEVMGEDAATVFYNDMDSSDEFLNDKTTYTFNKPAYDVWIDMLSVYMDKHILTVRKHEMIRKPVMKRTR